MALVACSTPDKKDNATMATASDSASVQAAPVANTKTKIDRTKVPKQVTDLFYADYPGATVNDADWYGYPNFDYVNDWYDYDPDLYLNQDPDAYLVQFTQDSIAQTALYTKAGKKIALHKAVSDLPAAVSAAISKGDYKTWTIGKDKEEAFQDKDSDKLKVYKVTVSMGAQKHILYLSSSGKVIKDKKVS